MSLGLRGGASLSSLQTSTWGQGRHQYDVKQELKVTGLLGVDFARLYLPLLGKASEQDMDYWEGSKRPQVEQSACERTVLTGGA